MKKLIIVLSAMLLTTGCFTVNAFDPETAHQIQVTQDEDAGIEASVATLPESVTVNGIVLRFKARDERIARWKQYEAGKNPAPASPTAAVAK